MTALPNPWITPSAAVVMPVAETAVTSFAPAPLVDVTANHSPSPMTTEDIKAHSAVAEPVIAGATDRFILDAEAFMNDIEPLPAFLSAPSQSYLRASDLIPVLETLAGVR